MDNILMLIIILFLAITILLKAHPDDDQRHFFDLRNSTAMRGFWCLVIMLVHVPMAHTNRIQDIIGSFAYIGVTFFFMTSSYGLTLTIDKKPERIKRFWRDRLPKLLVVSLLVNLVAATAFVTVGIVPLSIELFGFVFNIDLWVRWLLVCYLIFWITHISIKDKKVCNFIISAAVIVFSIFMYCLNSFGIYEGVTWTTECYGFIWGIVLANMGVSFYMYIKKKWLQKTCILCLASLALGVMYLKFKYIPFAGDYLLKVLLGIAILMFVLALNVRYSFGNRINQFIGEMSFEVYLIHGRVYDVFDHLCGDSVSSGVFIAVSIFVTLVISFIIHKAAKYLIARIYRWKFLAY